MKKSLLSICFVILLTACRREEIETVQIPKETPAKTPVVQQQVLPANSAPAANSTGFSAAVPENWTEKPGGGMRIASYSIENTAIDFYLISLTMGDVPSNVNRWRGQVGLPPASPEEIKGEIAAFKADGRDVNYIEIYNSETGNGIIAAIVDLAPKYWYFTAKGSVDELKENAADIRKFIESIKIQ